MSEEKLYYDIFFGHIAQLYSPALTSCFCRKHFIYKVNLSINTLFIRKTEIIWHIKVGLFGSIPQETCNSGCFLSRKSKSLWFVNIAHVKTQGEKMQFIKKRYRHLAKFHLYVPRGNRAVAVKEFPLRSFWVAQ